jgi:aryl-alcohol dehydrogenase-like predicted oxidoreductase
VELILGTAQLVRRYGVTASHDPDLDDARGLLDAARELGIRTLDTAPNYGDAEAVIGSHGGGFAVHTKLDPSLPPADSLRRSLERLGRERVDVLHLHDSAAVHASGTLAAAHALVGHGTEQLGASIYTATELEAVVADGRLGVVQVPLNLLDRRIDDTLLQRAADAGVRVLARSVLLQGLLGDPPAAHGRVPGLDAALDLVVATAARLGRTPLALALGWVRARPGVKGVVLGAETPAQLRTLAAVHAEPALDDEERSVLADLPLPAGLPVDPRAWPQR